MQQFDLDTVLMSFEQGSQSWTIREAVEGVQIFGGIGSGKTSGSGKTLALKYLKAGFGGLALTAKADEKNLWIKYCTEAGRLDDLVVIEPGGNNFFNFLEYESMANGQVGKFTENVVQVLKTVIEASEQKSGHGNQDPFWENALDMLIFNIVDLSVLAYGKTSVELMYDIMMAAPKSKADKAHNPTESSGKANAFSKAMTLAKAQAEADVAIWQRNESEDRIAELQKNPSLFEDVITNEVPSVRMIKFIDNFFTDSYRSIGDRTRSLIEFSFSGFLFRLLREPVYTLFCNRPSNVTPEASLEGKILLLDLPVKQYDKIGRDAQIMFKYVWQRAMEKRKVEDNARPVFLWADEAQHFLHEHDPVYQATARSSRIATVYISQNLPNYLVNMKGDKSDHRVKSFLGTLSTKIFHANADNETNEYASKLIGKAWGVDRSESMNMSGHVNLGETESHKLEDMVRPEEFAYLKIGGPTNHHATEAYMIRQGRIFKRGWNFEKITFRQNIS